jgi:serine/threonine-protein kinase
LLKAFNHPSIPTLHASGEQDGVAFMVMDRVNGIDLATVLGHREGRAQPLAKEVAVYIMGQLADALRHVHTIELLDEDEPQSLGIVHRDIRPSNVLLSPGGDAVLIGFGAARSQWLEPEHDDRMAGDLAYMAPERLTEAGTATEHSDLFALAVLLWEMLRGERCLAGPDEASTRENITRFEIAQASRRVPGLSPKLSEILRKNLDRDPGRRYGSAYQMLQRLAQAPEAQVAEQSRAELGARVRAAIS